MHSRQLSLCSKWSEILAQEENAEMLLKLDITRAFDNISWTYLLKLMQQMGLMHVGETG